MLHNFIGSEKGYALQQQQVNKKPDWVSGTWFFFKVVIKSMSKNRFIKEAKQTGKYRQNCTIRRVIY